MPQDHQLRRSSFRSEIALLLTLLSMLIRSLVRGRSARAPRAAFARTFSAEPAPEDKRCVHTRSAIAAPHQTQLSSRVTPHTFLPRSLARARFSVCIMHHRRPQRCPRRHVADARRGEESRAIP